MVDGTDSPGDHDRDGPPAIVKTMITTDSDTAEYDFLEVVADLEGVRIEDLPSLYDQVDHFVEQLFSRPPAPEAQVELSFSYAGYRIRLTQNGELTVLPVKDSIWQDRN